MPEPRPHPSPRRAGHRSARARRRRTTVAVLLLGLTFVLLMFVFVYPTRTFMQQRREVNGAQQRLQVLEESTKSLKRDNVRLQSDAEVERRAREDYGLVRPGETPYVLVPAPATPPGPLP